jgi:hypothetical protein
VGSKEAVKREDMLEFRLHSEGTNKNPLWGIAFKHKDDVSKTFDCEVDKRPYQIDIIFPDGKTYTFGIRPSFWNGCYEFLDAQVKDKTTGKFLREVRPIKILSIDKLGYKIETKNKCMIQIQVVERNKILRIVNFT